MSQRLAAMWSRARPVLLKGGLVVVVLVALFEIGLRVLPPDAVQYEVQVYHDGGEPVTTSGTITDSATISKWRIAMTQTPTGRMLVSVLVAQQQQQIVCASGPIVTTASYVFEWHGLLLESVAQLPDCREDYWVSSGGIPDPRTYLVPMLPQGQQ